MGNERAAELIRKYLEGNATPEEEALLESWYIAAAQEQPGMPGMPDYAKIGEEILGQLRAEQGERAEQEEQEQQGKQKDRPVIKIPVRRLWSRVAAAAVILVILSIASFFVFHKRPAPEVVKGPPKENEILPAGISATLTLLDGQTIPLDSAGKGTLAQQGNTTIRSQNGQLIYSPDRSGSPAAPTASNTLVTRPGEHYSLLLPDGTKAWLNAASSISYPVSFAANERRVTVTGEVYFEIVHNARQPFRIAVKDQVIEDIGTLLNVNAYADEPIINTTLLEGSVKVIKGRTSAILKPGQQAAMGPNDSSFQIKNVDGDEAIAWKNGYFYFNRADIRTVMRQLARWYNVEVVYKGDLPKNTFKGKVYRNIGASEALKILSYFGAHFQIEGRTITVSS